MLLVKWLEFIISYSNVVLFLAVKKEAALRVLHGQEGRQNVFANFSEEIIN